MKHSDQMRYLNAVRYLLIQQKSAKFPLGAVAVWPHNAVLEQQQAAGRTLQRTLGKGRSTSYLSPTRRLVAQRQKQRRAYCEINAFLFFCF